MAEDIPVIEFLKDKVYLGAYDSEPEDTATRVHFSIDDVLPYNNFHHDFGPLSISHLYRFSVILHEILGSDANAGKAVVYYSSTDPRNRANAACVLCSYMVLIQSWPPHLALAPIAQAQPPLMPFRDAGYSVADFVLTIQDVVYGLWRAKENGLLDLRSFDIEEYEYYEMVENGDLNAIAPHFVAFASPVQDRTSKTTYNPKLSGSFRRVLDYFDRHSVKLVVRLNSHLYDKEEFEKRGIKHIDLIFEDGTCPSMTYVQGFIGAVEGAIKDGSKIAVHCRAGLGRTGCLIGAHLIYTYGFTAQEAIGYMRFLRPGMVVGSQQHWLYLHQNSFRDWRRTMRLSRIADDSLAGYCPIVSLSSPEGMRSPSGAIRSPSGTVPRTPERSILGNVNNTNSVLPVPTPGQPRKSPSPAPVRVRYAPVASRYQTIQNNGTNSDDEGSTDDEMIHPGILSNTSAGGIEASPEDRGMSVSRTRATPSEPTCSPRRRTVTEYAQYTQEQQRALASKIRTVSSPRRRKVSGGSTPASEGTVTPVGTVRRARVASVHK